MKQFGEVEVGKLFFNFYRAKKLHQGLFVEITSPVSALTFVSISIETGIMNNICVSMVIHGRIVEKPIISSKLFAVVLYKVQIDPGG